MVVGVSICFFLPRRVVSLTSGDEFHSLKNTMYPSRFSHCWSRLSCVDLPDPSMPSTMKSLPGNWWSPYIRIGEKYKQTTRLLQTVMSGQLGLTVLILALL